MEKENAIQKVNEIHSILLSSNRILYSGKKMIYDGCSILIFLAIYYFSDEMTFGTETIKNSLFLKKALPLITLAIIFSIGAKGGLKEKYANNVHPLLLKTFRFEKPFAAVCILIGISLDYLGSAELVLPILLIVSGLMYQIISVHAIPVIKYASWGLIGGGVVYLYLLKSIENTDIWMFGAVWLCVMLIWMGLSSIKFEKLEKAHYGA